MIDREDFTRLKKDRKSEGLLDSRVCGLCMVFIVAELSTNGERVSADQGQVECLRYEIAPLSKLVLDVRYYWRGIDCHMILAVWILSERVLACCQIRV